MQTITVEITHNNALKALHALEEKQFIKIVEGAEVDSPSLSGQPLSIQAFKNWILDAENTPTMDLKDAKALWASKRKLLLQIAK